MSGGGGADMGQAANRAGQGGGWSLPSLGDMANSLGDLWGDADAGALAGGGVAEITDPEGPADWATKFRKGATDAVLSQYPGYGTIWTYDGAPRLTVAGWLVAGGLGLLISGMIWGGR